MNAICMREMARRRLRRSQAKLVVMTPGLACYYSAVYYAVSPETTCPRKCIRRKRMRAMTDIMM